MTTAFERSEKTGREPEGRVQRTELPEAGRRKDIETQIIEMNEMKLPDLQARFAEVVGEETKAPNKTYLIKRIVAVLEQEGEQDDVQADETETAISDTDNGENEEQEGESLKTDDSLPYKEHSLSKLDVDELRDLYIATVGRSTGSTDRRYLIWKITQARKGNIAIGPIPNRRGDGVEREYKVLPLRMETDLVEKLDEAWKRHGFNSRMEFFRQSLSAYMADKGEAELAEMLVL